MSGFFHDLTFALRALRRRPGVTVFAVLTLALGIGATTALWSVVRTVLLRPLPYPEPERLALVWERFPAAGYDQLLLAGAGFLDLRDSTDVFEALAAFRFEEHTLSGGGDPLAVEALAVTPELFTLLGAPMSLGRVLTTTDDGAAVVVLGHRLWRDHFGADPAIVGRSLRVGGVPHVVVGVLAADFRPPPFTLGGETYTFTNGGDLFLPLATAELAAERQRRDLLVLGRLTSGLTAARADARLAAVAGRLAAAHPDAYPAGLEPFVAPLHEQAVAPVRPVLRLLQVAVTLVLLIACADVAGLLFAHVGGRRREMAVRQALGAGRGRLLRQLLLEGALLGAVSGILGAGLAYGALQATAALGPADVPRLAEARIDGAALTFAITLAAAAGLVACLLPALGLSRAATLGGLASGVRGAGRGRRRVLAHKLLVMGELALSVTLLVAAGLLLRSFQLLSAVDPGFDPRDLVAVSLVLPAERYPDAAALHGVVDRLLTELRALPDVAAAAAANGLPLATMIDGTRYRLAGAPAVAEGAAAPVAALRRVSPGYVQTLAIRHIAGRDFASGDHRQAARVVLVNDSFVRRNFSEGGALGQRLQVGQQSSPEEGWARVVGVVGDVRLGGPENPAKPTIYVPLEQDPRRRLSLALRSRPGATLSFQRVRDAIWAVDRELPLTVSTVEERLAEMLARPRGAAFLVGAVAAVALLLGVLGLYGLMAFLVAERRHEMGIRAAFGATGAQLVALHLRLGAGLALTGLVIGLAMALVAGELLASFLYGVTADDRLILFGAVIVLLATALVATYLPARRALPRSPVALLRCE